MLFNTLAKNPIVNSLAGFSEGVLALNPTIPLQPKTIDKPIRLG